MFLVFYVKMNTATSQKVLIVKVNFWNNAPLGGKM
jgi:hypothetical protein